MKTARILLVIGFSLTIMNCNRSESAPFGESPQEVITEDASWAVRNYKKNKWRWNRLKNTTPECDIRESQENDPFYCVKKACENAKGEFNPKTHQCDCDSDDKKFLIFTPLFGGACVPPRPSNEIPLDPSNDRQRSRFKIQVGENSVERSSEAMMTQAESPNVIRAPKAILFSHAFYIQEIENLELAQDLLFNIDRDRGLSHNSVDFRISRKQVFLRDLGVGESVPIAQEAEKFADVETNYNNFVFVSKDGCRTQCYAEKWEKRSNHYVVLRDLYVEGFRVSRKVYFTNQKDISTYFVMIVLDSNNRANLIYERSSENPKPGIFKHKVDILSADGNSLFADVLLSPPVEYNEQALSEVTYPSSVEADQRMVTVCEWGANPFSFKDRWERVVFGPYARQNSDFEGSVWGWLENSEKDPLTYSSGFYPQFQTGYMPFESYLAYTSHHKNVTNSILDSSASATITVLDYSNCLSSDISKNPLLDETFPGKVVNVSAFNEIFGADCDNFSKVVQSTEGRLLWVLSAGNDDRNTCEREKFFNLPNVITVTSIHPSSPKYIERDMVRGKLLIDTASFRTTEYGTGTSYAAPVLSALAADIALTYPHFSPIEIKRVLKLGVEFSRMNVASGGRTDKETSFYLAKKLSDHPNWSNEQILKDFYQIGSESSYYQMQNQKRKLERSIEDNNNDIRAAAKAIQELEKCIDDGGDQGGWGDWGDWWSGEDEDQCDGELSEFEEQIAQYQKDIERLESNNRKLKADIGKLMVDYKKYENYLQHIKWIQ